MHASYAMSSLLRIAIVLAVLAASSRVQADQPVFKTLTLGDAVVSMLWSPDWRIDESVARQQPGTVGFETEDALRLHVLISVAPPTPGLDTDAGMREVVGKMTRMLAPQSVEKELPTQTIAGASARGFYVCATDPAPKPDEYRYICQGVVSTDGRTLAFTVLYNDSGKGEVDTVIAALKTLEVSKPT
jgi:hypothetical protein